MTNIPHDHLGHPDLQAARVRGRLRQDLAPRGIAPTPNGRSAVMADSKHRRPRGDRDYQTSPIERTRTTKAEVEARRKALLDIIEADRPMTVRQVFLPGDCARPRREG
jgi:hypothetical protein